MNSIALFRISTSPHFFSEDDPLIYYLMADGLSLFPYFVLVFYWADTRTHNEILLIFTQMATLPKCYFVK